MSLLYFVFALAERKHEIQNKSCSYNLAKLRKLRRQLAVLRYVF